MNYRSEIRQIFVILLASLVISPAWTQERQQDIRELRQEMRTFHDHLIQEINKQRAAYSEDMGILREQQAALLSNIGMYADEVQEVREQLIEVVRKVNSLKDENARIQAKNEDQLNRIMRLVSDEQKVIAENYNKVVRGVADELAQMEKQIDKTGGTATASYRNYTVVEGDTLGAIAKAFNVPLKVLKDYNGLPGDTILIGQQLKIPQR